MMRIPRGTHASAERKKVPCWYFWRGRVTYVCKVGHNTVLRFANGSGVNIRSDGLVMGALHCTGCDETFPEVWLEDWIVY